MVHAIPETNGPENVSNIRPKILYDVLIGFSPAVDLMIFLNTSVSTIGQRPRYEKELFPS